MKTTIKNCRLILSLVYLLGMSQIAHAQWARTAPNVYLTTGTDRVGIGTTTPTQKLDVNGDAVINGLRIGRGKGDMPNNTIIGNAALNSNRSGNGNTAIGSVSLYSNTEGNYNTAVGRGALYSNSLGIWNTASGYQALYHNTTATYNVATGGGALYYNTTGSNNTANGYLALYSSTTGSNNTASGFNALYSNTTGYSNTATGQDALHFNTTGFFNTANGYNAMYVNTTGHDNTADGYGALFFNTTGNYNTASGMGALYFNTTGTNNTATGYLSLFVNKTGLNNTASGYKALYSNTTGSTNAAFGNGSLQSNTTGSNNTSIGFNSDVSSGDLVNATAIGANAIVTGSNQMQLGSSTTILSTSGGYTIVSDGRFKDEIKTDDAPGLAFINKLRPVTYNFNYKRYDDFLRKDMKANKTISDQYQQQLAEKSKQRQVGFIAQEVDQVCRDNKFSFNGVYAPQNSSDNYSIDYSRFVVPLVKAVQELASENEQLKKDISELKKTVYANSNMNNGTATIAINAATDAPLLGQNIPNPAANNTIIPFRIPKNCNSASIVVSEMASGKIVTAIPVSCSETHLAIDAGTLASGSYTYSLYINGKLLDSKQMILVK